MVFKHDPNETRFKKIWCITKEQERGLRQTEEGEGGLGYDINGDLPETMARETKFKQPSNLTEFLLNEVWDTYALRFDEQQINCLHPQFM